MNYRIIGLLAAMAAVAPSFSAAHGNAHQGHQGHQGQPAASAAAPAETAFGRQGDPKKVSRTFAIEMSDNMRYTPSRLTVKRGETVRLQVLNKGKLLHELVLGTPEELKRHAQAMKAHPGMAHDEPHMVHVEAGKRGELVWQFTQAGEFQFACLLPGHFEAGMVGTVVVQ